MSTILAAVATVATWCLVRAADTAPVAQSARSLHPVVLTADEERVGFSDSIQRGRQLPHATVCETISVNDRGWTGGHAIS